MITVKENLELLLQVVQQHPEAEFNLDYYKRVTPCGTLFCSLGLASTVSSFQEQGLPALDWHAEGSVGVFTKPIHDILDTIFGPKAHDRLFAPRRSGSRDLEIMQPYAKGFLMHDKELAIKRIEKALSET